MTTLESGYRRLLALYPTAHRDLYGEEMLSTLMEGAADRQRLPRLRETWDLLWNALLMQVEHTARPAGRDPRWAAAIAVFAPLAALVQFALLISWPWATLAYHEEMPGGGFPVTRTTLAVAAMGLLWALVAVLASLALRRIAALGAWAATLAALTLAFYQYPGNPPGLLTRWSSLVLGLIVAIALSLPQPARVTLRQVIGGRLIGFTVFAALLGAGAQWAEAQTLSIVYLGEGTYGVSPLGDISFSVGILPAMGVFSLAAMVVALAVGIRVLVKAGGPTRRRLLALALTPLVTAVFVSTLFQGFAYSSMQFWPTPVLLNAAQWLSLALVPLITFGIGLIVVRRKDNQQRLIELGRATLTPAD